MEEENQKKAKIKFNMLSLLGLMLTSMYVAVVINDIAVSHFLKSMLFFSIGWVWQSFMPIVSLEEIKEEKGEDDV